MAQNIAGMEKQIRLAALSMLPAEPNATWQRIVAGPVNDLGEPTTASPTTWPVRVFFLRLRGATSYFTPAGEQPRSQPRFLMAAAEGDTTWTPEKTDTLLKDGERWRLVELQHLDVDGRRYYEATAERVL